MKTIVLALVALFSLSHFVQAAGDEEQGGGAEKTLLVKVTDQAEQVTFELMSPADFQELQKRIAAEAKFHSKALAAAEKAWKEDEETKKKSFPKGAITVRKAQPMKEFTDSSKASDALSNEENKEIDKAKALKEKQEAKEKAAIEKKITTKEKIDKEKRKDDEKESLCNSARSLYETKLQELMAPAGEGGGAEGAKDEAKEEKKEKKEDKKAK